MTDAPKTDPVTTGPQPTQAPAFALVALLALGMGLHAFAWFMAIIVLPQIVQNFGGAESLHWTTTLYMAATILASAIAGPGMARHGSGRVLAAGAAVFILGALICGTAWSMVPFLVGRTLQGFGEGLVIGASFGLIRQIYPPDQVPKAFSLMGIVFASAALIAPILAGGLEAYFGWRSVFAFHGVLGLVVGAMALLLLPAPRYARDDPTRPPGPGLETILPSAVAGLGLLSIGLIPHLPEPWMGLGPLIALPLLCRAALKLDARSPAPLCPPGLFNPATPLGLGFWVVLLLPIGMGGIYSHVPTLVASGFRIDPILAGQATLLVALAWSASAWITSRVIKTPGSPEAIRAAPILLGLGLCLIALGFTDLVGTGLLLPASAIGLGMLLIGTAMGSSWG
ncbi:MAG: MFS transporter, partial [Rhodospirillaceae bacterium]